MQARRKNERKKERSCRERERERDEEGYVCVPAGAAADPWRAADYCLSCCC